MPYEGAPGAFWALLAAGRRAPATRRTTSTRPSARDPGDRLSRARTSSPSWLLEPDDPDEVSAYFESRCHVASSARRGGASGRGATGSARSSSGSPRSIADATIALRFRTAARAARLGDALRADDRREREPRHRAAVREVPAARGLPGGAAGGARARHLRDRLLPPEGEVDPRDDAGAAGGVRRRGAAHGSRSCCGCPASRARRRTSSRPSSATRRASSSTRTCAGSRSGSA